MYTQTNPSEGDVGESCKIGLCQVLPTEGGSISVRKTPLVRKQLSF